MFLQVLSQIVFEKARFHAYIVAKPQFLLLYSLYFTPMCYLDS